ALSRNGSSPLRQLSRCGKQRFDSGAEIFFVHCPWMIKPYNAAPVYQHNCRRGADSKSLEVTGVQRNAGIWNTRIIMRVDLVDKRRLDGCGCMLILSRIAVTARGRHNHQTLGAELLRYFGNDRCVSFAVGAPMRPEKN